MAQVGIVILSASPQALWSATQPDNPAVLRLAAGSQEGLYRSGDCKFAFDREK